MFKRLIKVLFIIFISIVGSILVVNLCNDSGDFKTITSPVKYILGLLICWAAIGILALLYVILHSTINYIKHGKFGN